MQERAFGREAVEQSQGTTRRSDPQIIAQAFGISLSEAKKRIASGEKFPL